jgi:hypothetical protein
MQSENARQKDRFTDRGVQVGSSRFIQLMQAMKRMSRLHKQAISAQINARQKRRAAGFKRRDVWICDAAFMKELQVLMAQEKLRDFEGAEGLLKLAEECQTVRNDLGPLEQDGTEAEQQLEGEIWELQQAADSMYDDFEKELASAEMYPSAPTSASSSSYQSKSEYGYGRESEDHANDNTMDMFRPPDSVASTSSFNVMLPEPAIDLGTSQDYMLRGVNDMRKFRGSDPDSAIGDIDSPYERWTPGDLIGPFQPVQRTSSASLARYPELITEIETTRERVNKWLLNTTLLSHLEADILRQQLDSQMNSTPSNWSQLVVAYWGKDEAAEPSQKKVSRSQSKFHRATSHQQIGSSAHQSRSGAGFSQHETQHPDSVKLSMPVDYHSAFSEFKPRRRDNLKTIVPARPAPSAPHPQICSDQVKSLNQEVPKRLEPP